MRRLFGPEAEADPRKLHEELRAEYGEVAPVLVHGDLPAWLVLSHAANLEVLRNSAVFSRDSRLWWCFQEGRVPADSPLLPMVAWQPVCVFNDGPAHQRLRRAILDSLARLQKRGVRKHVTRAANQLVDSFCAAGRADLVTQFAEYVPMHVMTQLFGITNKYDCRRLVDAARDLMMGTATANESNEYVIELLRGVVQQRRQVPGNDLPSWLLEHEAQLTDAEVAEHLRLLLVAANESTVNLIAEALRMMLTDTRFKAQLSGGTMTLDDALEDVLWNEPPLPVIPGRWTTNATVLGGWEIPAGELVILGIMPGNRDPNIRPDPTESMHGNRSHLSFGSGPHECPGSDLGRIIAATAIDTLLERLTGLQLAVLPDELQSTGTWMTHHLTALPVEFIAHVPVREEPVPQQAAPQLPPAVPVSERSSAPAPSTRRRWLRGLGQFRRP